LTVGALGATTGSGFFGAAFFAVSGFAAQPSIAPH
jgi:hypothetical protein